MFAVQLRTAHGVRLDDVVDEATGALTTRCLQASETLCRKGGTSRSDNAPHASGACAGAKLACGATLSATREFAWLAWVVNLHVVAVMITTREPLALIVATHFISRHNYLTKVCYSH